MEGGEEREKGWVRLASLYARPRWPELTEGVGEEEEEDDEEEDDEEEVVVDVRFVDVDMEVVEDVVEVLTFVDVADVVVDDIDVVDVVVLIDDEEVVVTLVEVEGNVIVDLMVLASLKHVGLILFAVHEDDPVMVTVDVWP